MGRPMTMLGDGLCDCCGKNEAIGVASTIIPMSIAWCLECLRSGVQPYVVIVTSASGIMPPGETLDRTWINREYLDIYERTLKFHGKTWEEFAADVKKSNEAYDKYLSSIESEPT